MLHHVSFWLSVLILCQAKVIIEKRQGTSYNEKSLKLLSYLQHFAMEEADLEEADIEESEYRRSCTTSACDNAADLSLWVQDIFEGIDEMPREGSHGKLCCFGENAFPILIGSDDADIIVAVSQLGQGRIAVTAQKNYLDDIMRYDDTSTEAKGIYYKNMKRWLTQNDYTGNEQFCWITKLNRLNNCLNTPEVKVLLWQGWNIDWITDEHVQQVKNFIENGGALYFSDTIWQRRIYAGYGDDDYPLYEQGFYPIVEQAGIGVTLGGGSAPNMIPVLKDEEGIDRLKGLNLVILSSKLNTFDDLDTETYFDTAISYIDTRRGLLSPATVLEMAQMFEPFAESITDGFQFPVGSYGDEGNTIPVGTKEQTAFKLFTALGWLGLWRDVAPGSEYFPGAVPDSAEFKTFSAQFVSTVDYEHWHSTGHYLKPGQTMTLTINDEGDGTWKKYRIWIGCNMHSLYGRTELVRWPLITREIPISSTTMEVTSPFGGLVFLYSKKSGRTIDFTISGVVEAPYFVLDDADSMAEWQTRRNAPGPWTDLVSNYMRITLPSEVIRDYAAAQIEEAMRFWNDVVESNYNLLALPASERRMQFVAPDIELTSDFTMHAGYPIGTHLDKVTPTQNKFILQTDNPSVFWGMFHEIGHNMQLQHGTMWKPDGFTEITCNVLSLYQMNRVAGQPLWAPSWLWNKITGNTITNWLANPSLEDNKSAGMALVPYAQLVREFGWNCYHAVFQSYEDDLLSADGSMGYGKPADNQAVIDQWIVRWSRIVDYNIAPIFAFIDLPFSEFVDAELEGYTPFLPTDEVTTHSDAGPLVAEIEEQFPGLVRMVTTLPDCPDISSTKRFLEDMEKKQKQQETKILARKLLRYLSGKAETPAYSLPGPEVNDLSHLI